MKKLAGLSCTFFVSSFALVPTNALASGSDPCDFATSGQKTFSYQQVMSCYRSVPFSSADLHNIVDVVRQHRSFSDLGEIYDERIQWKRALAELDAPGAEERYPNDLAMHDALKGEHKRFRDAHVSYQPPACYWRVLNAFIPFEFGSTVRRHHDGSREQIIFVEAAPILPAEYQAATGINPEAFVGTRVVSINGVPVLDYFRRYAEVQKTHEDAGGGLNGVLADFAYSVRIGAGNDFLPERASDTFVLESIDGKRQTIELPWLFTLSGQVMGSYALPPTASSEEFRNLCQSGPAEATTDDASARLMVPWDYRDHAAEHHHRAVRRFREQQAQHRDRPRATGYFEVEPTRLGQDLEEVIPLTGSARVVQYGADVTAIQLGDTVGWIDVARQGVEHACQHSKRLIIDLRNNNGGNDTVIRWLHHYLLPEGGALIPAGMLPIRVRNDNPLLNEILFNFALFAEGYMPELGMDPCLLGLVPECVLDVDRGTHFAASKVDWAFVPTHHEVRGGALLSLSRQFGLPPAEAVFDAATCAGRFSGDNLVLLTNGSNASGGYFLPAAFKGEGVIVNSGGILGEPMAMGRARGGATVGGSVWSEGAKMIESLSHGEIRFPHEPVGFTRPVESQMEMLGVYRKDRRRLHIEHPVEADLHVNVWTNLPGSEGFVYERVLHAVDEHRRCAASK